MQKMSTPNLEFIKKNIKNRNKNLSDADLDRMASEVLRNYLNSNSEKIKKDKKMQSENFEKALDLEYLEMYMAWKAGEYDHLKSKD